MTMLNRSNFNMRYSILTAVKNEENYIEQTLQSVCAQEILPEEWIIMNDGSNDKSAIIIETYALRHPWIKHFYLENFEPCIRSTGGRVSRILNKGYSKLNVKTHIVVKLDADTKFDPTFFPLLLQEFLLNKKLGIASGNLVFNGKAENISPHNNEVRGAVMLIRRKVFEQLHGFLESKGSGEDTLFAVSARFYGWKTKTFPVFFEHLKPEGIKNSSLYNSYITGLYKGSIPYRLDYFLVTQGKHMLKKPVILGSIIQVLAYFKSRYLINYRPFPGIVRVQLNKEQKNFFLNRLKIMK